MHWGEYFEYAPEFESGLRRVKAVKGFRAGTMVGTRRPDGRWSLVHRGKRYLTYRIIWELHNCPIPEGYEIDHIDGDVGNNDISNLRLATRGQNARNRAKNKRSLPGGISWANVTFCARVACDGVVYKKFGQDIQALLEWVKGQREELHGEFANHSVRSL